MAAEVRKLAERSKTAASEIVELSKKSLYATEEANTLLISVIPEIEKTALLLQEITAASEQQRSGTVQINNAVQQLNTVTQQNVSSAEELASNAEELNSQAEELMESINFFNVTDINTK